MNKTRCCFAEKGRDMKKFYFLLFSLLLVLCQANAKALWVYVGSNVENQEQKIWVDVNSIKGKSVRTAWTLLSIGGGETAKILKKHLCNQGKVIDLYTVFYDKNDKIKGSATVDGEYKIFYSNLGLEIMRVSYNGDYIIPDSLGEGEFNFVCQYKK